MPRCKVCFFVLMLSVLFAGNLVPRLASQVVRMNGVPDSPESYVCTVNGLKGMGRDCGTKDAEMVLTAEILSIASAPNGEFHLTLRPETVFKGSPTAGMQIVTAQRRCLPAIRVGDSWLFSLARDEESKELVLNYGSRSGPVEDEREEIDSLRKLAGLDDAGVVKGSAYLEQETGKGGGEHRPSAHHTIILTRLANGLKLKALTNKMGRFEFKPVPAGEYDLDPNTKRGLWTRWSGRFDVEPHACTDFDLDFQTDGQIAGRLIFPGDVDPSEWEVEVTPADDPGVVPASAWTDNSGGFVLHGLSPGRYVVMLEKTEQRDGPNLRLDLFAPGVPERANAQVIEVGKGGRVEGIEMVVPRSAME